MTHGILTLTNLLTRHSGGDVNLHATLGSFLAPDNLNDAVRHRPDLLTLLAKRMQYTRRIHLLASIGKGGWQNVIENSHCMSYILQGMWAAYQRRQSRSAPRSQTSPGEGTVIPPFLFHYKRAVGFRLPLPPP